MKIGGVDRCLLGSQYADCDQSQPSILPDRMYRDGGAGSGSGTGLSRQNYLLVDVKILQPSEHRREIYISHTHMYRTTSPQGQVFLNINDVNTDWSILFFFDLKDYISYCKDVYKYFNLSSVNFL